MGVKNVTNQRTDKAFLGVGCVTDAADIVRGATNFMRSKCWWSSGTKLLHMTTILFHMTNLFVMWINDKFIAPCTKLCSLWRIYNVCCLLVINAVLTQNSYCRNLRTFVWRKMNPKILSVEQKWQIWCMNLISYPDTPDKRIYNFQIPRTTPNNGLKKWLFQGVYDIWGL